MKKKKETERQNRKGERKRERKKHTERGGEERVRELEMKDTMNDDLGMEDRRRSLVGRWAGKTEIVKEKAKNFQGR